MGMSTLGILYALERKGGGKHVAIDPYQNRPIDYFDISARVLSPTHGYDSIALSMVERAGLLHMLEHTDEPSYIALPRLVKEGRRFDLIFIDGYHTFDYAFVDYFYSDLLLRDGGFLIFDDVNLPMIHKVCWFIETHKLYRRLGPRVMTHPLNSLFRAWVRILRALNRRGPRGNDPEWGSIMAYQKLETTMVRPVYFHTDFYPYFRSWWALKRLRGLYGALTGRAKLPQKTPRYGPPPR